MKFTAVLEVEEVKELREGTMKAFPWTGKVVGRIVFAETVKKWKDAESVIGAEKAKYWVVPKTLEPRLATVRSSGLGLRDVVRKRMVSAVAVVGVRIWQS